MELSRNNATDEDLKKFCEDNPDLEELDLGYCNNITDEGLKHLKGMKKLKKLDLWGCKITDEGLSYLEGLQSLEFLSLWGCKNITDEGLKHLEDMELKELYLYGCNNITSEGLKYINNNTKIYK